MCAAIRTSLITGAVAYLATTAVIYWWLVTGPWPEDAWS